jgi:C1A family cysteine protease
MNTQITNERLRGCLLEQAPSPAPKLVISGTAGGIPPAMDLRPYCSAVENQGQLNSCAANSVVGAMEYLRNRMNLPPVELSRLFVYYNARKLADREKDDQGTLMHHALAAVLAYGVCEERMWPYQEAMVNEAPTNACYSNATRYEAIEYARADTPDLILAALGSGLPVVFGAFFPQEFYWEASRTGAMPLVAQANTERPAMGHAMLLVGYDLQTRMFIIRNSYGTDFGRQGYALVPFDTMFAHSQMFDFWTIGAISKHRGLSLMGPTVAATVSATRSNAKEQAVSVMRTNSLLRDKITGELDAAKKGFRDRLRGPGVGGGY